MTRSLDNGDPVQRIARVIIVVFTCVRIGLAVEDNILVIAYLEYGIYIHYLLDSQVDTVIYTVAVFACTGEFVLSGLTVSHAMPCDRCGRT